MAFDVRVVPTQEVHQHGLDRHEDSVGVMSVSRRRRAKALRAFVERLACRKCYACWCWRHGVRNAAPCLEVRR